MEKTEFTVGKPEDWRDFQMRHPKFVQNLQYLNETMIKVFLREIDSSEFSGLADKVVFYLGRLAVEDFNEILLLCGNGYGIGAMKLLRGFYERVVTLMYISKNPGKADDFFDYHKIHQAKLLNHAKAGLSLDEINVSEEKISEIQNNYLEVKERFQVSCKKCGVTRTMNSWSELDTLSMARKVGIEKLYLHCFYQPTLQVHTTVASLSSRVKIKDGDALTFKEGPQNSEADISLYCAHNLILRVLIAINDHFKMGLQTELEERFRDFQHIWGVKED